MKIIKFLTDIRTILIVIIFTSVHFVADYRNNRLTDVEVYGFAILYVLLGISWYRNANTLLKNKLNIIR